MSIVKRGAYGYGQSKPVMNYHTTNSESVTTVVTEISRLSVSEKPPCTGAGAVKTHATLEDVCEEKEGAYSAYPYHSGGTVQKHGYSEQKASYQQHGSGVGGYGGGAVVHQDSTGTAQKHGYGGEHQAYQYGGGVKGYTALHQESTVQKHGYGVQKAYQHGSDVVGGYGHDGAVQKHGYGGQKAYQPGSNAGGYGAVPHDSTVQKHGYDEKKAYQHGGDAGGYGVVHHDSTVQKHNAYGGHHDSAVQNQQKHNAFEGHHDSTVKKHGYGEHNVYQHKGSDGYGYGDHKAQKQYGYGGSGHKTTYDDKHSYNGGMYQPGCEDGVAGYDALVVNKTTIKPGYGGVHCALGQGSMTGAVHQIAGAGGYHAGAHAQPCESEESDCSDDESDCEEELAYGQHSTGGLQHHDAYKQHGAGGNKLGSTHQYSAYERRQNLGGGSHYESYQSTTTQGYSGGGYGW